MAEWINLIKCKLDFYQFNFNVVPNLGLFWQRVWPGLSGKDLKDLKEIAAILKRLNSLNSSSH